jgi:hypothetical protein
LRVKTEDILPVLAGKRQVKTVKPFGLLRIKTEDILPVLAGKNQKCIGDQKLTTYYLVEHMFKVMKTN